MYALSRLKATFINQTRSNEKIQLLHIIASSDIWNGEAEVIYIPNYYENDRYVGIHAVCA